MEYVQQYSTVLQQLDKSLVDEEIGRAFPLWELVKENDSSRAYTEGIQKFLDRDDPTAAPAASDE